MTGQETANTDKPLRKDICGDPVAARLPYAFLTKVVIFVKWKRFEMNATIKFHSITEAKGKVRQCRSSCAAPSECARLLSDAGGHKFVHDSQIPRKD